MRTLVRTGPAMAGIGRIEAWKEVQNGCWGLKGTAMSPPQPQLYSFLALSSIALLDCSSIAFPRVPSHRRK